MGAQVEVTFPNESCATIALVGLWVVSEHHQVLVSVTADEGQRCVVHKVLNAIYLQWFLVLWGRKGKYISNRL